MLLLMFYGKRKIPVIEHAPLYEPGDLERHAENRNSLDYVETYLAEHDNHIVIKAK